VPPLPPGRQPPPVIAPTPRPPAARQPLGGSVGAEAPARSRRVPPVPKASPAAQPAHGGGESSNSLIPAWSSKRRKESQPNDQDSWSSNQGSWSISQGSWSSNQGGWSNNQGSWSGGTQGDQSSPADEASPGTHPAQGGGESSTKSQKPGGGGIPAWTGKRRGKAHRSRSDGHGSKSDGQASWSDGQASWSGGQQGNQDSTVYDEDQREWAASVRKLQGECEEACQAWHHFSDTRLGGVRDPTKHSSAKLEEFVDWAENDPFITECREIVRRVKEAHRSQDVQDRWDEYCEREGHFKNPARHPSWFLRQFLEVEGDGGKGGSKRRPKKASPDAKYWELAQRVKVLQRESMDACQEWHRAADAVGPNMRDPMQHPAEFLEGFLRGVERVAKESEDAINQVKEAQRNVNGASRSWHYYCDTEGNGMRNPHKHPVWFLRKFLDEVLPLGAEDLVPDWRKRGRPEEATAEAASASAGAAERPKKWARQAGTNGITAGAGGPEQPTEEPGATQRADHLSVEGLPPNAEDADLEDQPVAAQCDDRGAAAPGS